MSSGLGNNRRVVDQIRGQSSRRTDNAVGLQVFARWAGVSVSRAGTLCNRGMPHRRVGDKGHAIPPLAARAWLASSPHTDGRLCSAARASSLAGVHRDTMLRWMDRGLLPVHRTPDGRRWVSIDDLSKFMRERLPEILAEQPGHSQGNWRPSVTNADPTAPAWLYGIHDPKDGQCIYVGFSTDYKQRRGHHLACLRRGKHTNRQLQRLWDKRGSLKFRVMQTGMSSIVLHAEKEAIASLRTEIGSRLCNATDGGEGCVGLSRAARTKISKRTRLAQRSPEWRRRWAERRGKRPQDIWGEHWRTCPPLIQEALLDRSLRLLKSIARKIDKKLADIQAACTTPVNLTCAGEVLVPAKRGGGIVWVAAAASRADEFAGYCWNIVRHNGSAYRMKRNRPQSEGGGIIIPRKPYRILGLDA